MNLSSIQTLKMPSKVADVICVPMRARSLIYLATFALAIVPSTGQQVHKAAWQTTDNHLPSATVNSIASAIFRCENSRSRPYGVMIPTENPRRVCMNTITHAWVDFEREQRSSGSDKILTGRKSPSDNSKCLSLPFISFLGRRYCPPSVDPVGYHNWTNNMCRILCK